MSLHKNGLSKLIGVVVPSLSNAVFGDLIRGVQDTAINSGYRVIISDTRYSVAEEEKAVASFLAISPDALIITGGEQNETCKQQLRSAGLPIVQVMEILESPLDMNVGMSHWQAGYDVATYLMEIGRSRIGFIGAQMDIRAHRRMLGFRSALEERGLFQRSFVFNRRDPSSISLGVQWFKELMAATNNKLDAIFCVNDDLAMGAIFEGMRMGIKVPQDLAICGFNDIEASTYTLPSLTSVSVNRYEMGVRAAEMIIDRLKGKLDRPKVIDVGFEIIKRDSTLV